MKFPKVSFIVLYIFIYIEFKQSNGSQKVYIRFEIANTCSITLIIVINFT